MWKCVKNRNGDVVEGIGNILKRQVEYYKELYTSHSIDEVEAKILLRNVTRSLTMEQVEQCEKTIMVSECEKCICSLQNESSPGLDGITNSFHKTYFNVIGEELTEVINEVLDQGECCPSHYMGIIILHYKAAEREILNNWRPITLLNVDYKIIERVLAARLKTILPYIVDEDQKGYVDKRNISDAIRLNEDVIFHCEKCGKQGIILYVDQSKAFDRVEWKWMRLILEKFNFGNKSSYRG